MQTSGPRGLCTLALGLISLNRAIRRAKRLPRERLQRFVAKLEGRNAAQEFFLRLAGGFLHGVKQTRLEQRIGNGFGCL